MTNPNPERASPATKVLIVENKEATFTIAECEPASCDYGCTIVHSVAEATARLSSDPFELLIVARTLQDSDGIEFGSRASAMYGLPFIVVLDPDEEAMLDAASAGGAHCCLFRPCSRAQVRAAIRGTLQRTAELARMKRMMNALTEDLEGRKTIFVATGVIMERLRVTTEEARQLLRNMARNRREKIEKTATELIEGRAGMELISSVHKYLRRMEA